MALARQALAAFAVDAPPAATDGVTILCFAALFPILRVVLEKTVFRRVALYFVGKTEAARARARARLKGEKAEVKAQEVDAATKLPLKVAKKVDKFCESCWKLFVYASFSALLVAAIAFSSPTDSYASWLFDDKLMWVGLPGPQHVTLALKGIYLLELSFYVVAMPTLLFWETRRKDFNIMFCHHVVTILLIGFSFFFNYSRVGSAIMLLHDICDIFLEAAKLCKYAALELPANILFASFAVSWLLLRLLYYPFFCIKSAAFTSVAVMGEPPIFHNMFLVCLVALQIMHIFWFYMIVSMIVKALQKGGVQEDYRSDDEDDDD